MAKEGITSNTEQHKLENRYYIPSAELISYISLGNNTIFAKLSWFETINYFGKQLETDKDFSRLPEFCNLITKLDSHAIHYFDFCATSLSWFAKMPLESINILSRGIKDNPDNWKLFYLRGFNYWYFVNNYELAKEDMLKSVNTNNAPVFVSTLAARLLTKQQGAAVAVDFLKNEIKNTGDAKIRAELLSKLKQAYLAFGFEEINKAKENYFIYENKYANDIHMLIDKGYLKALPLEPYGGAYYINESGETKTTSAAKPLEFSGKTSETGLLKDEFLKR
ncbi:MAG: hypothetical protein KBC84_03135 [Proteobacteria bacterium]|nr:hypothetical protein [Pseudomonadota bacterium]